MGQKLRVPLSDIAPGELTLPASESHYVVRVRRLRAGDEIVVFDSDARTEADATIVAASAKAVICNVAEVRPASIVAPLPAVLIQALAKGDKPDRVIRDATCLGVRKVVIIETERSVPRPAGSIGTRRARWQKIAVDAARQSGRGDVPEIGGPTTFSGALALLGEPEGPCLVFSPEAEPSLGRALSDWRGDPPVTVLVGPEGGLSPDELALAIDVGFRPVSFGRLVLRTETASTAVLGALLALSDRGRFPESIG